MTQPFVKIWGLKRTSTNYLQWIIDNNSTAETFMHRFGWKHGAPGTKYEKLWCEHHTFGECDDLEGVERSNLYHLVMIKNPIAWYRSIRKWEDEPVDKFDKSYIDEWNENYNKWCELIDERWDGEIIRSIDLLDQTPKQFIRSLDIQGTQIWKDTHMRIATDATIAEEQGHFDPSYYTKRKWFDDVSNEIITEIRNHVDNDLINRFGFVVSQ